MKKKRRIWIFAVALALTAVQGTVFAGTQETESLVEDMTEVTETEIALNKTVSVETVKEQKDLPEETEHAEQISVKDRDETDIKKTSTKQVQKPAKKTSDGRTLLDVSQGSITISSAGATGGGYKQ